MMTSKPTITHETVDMTAPLPDVEAVVTGCNNARLLASAATLGYLPEPVLDATYGLGAFWSEYRPDDLTTNDLDQNTSAEYHHDFTALPKAWTDLFGSVVFDPPYKLNGTSTGSGPSALDARYGVSEAYRTIDQVHWLMRRGLRGCIRVCRPKGYILAKCQDQISSGRYWRQTTSLHEEAIYGNCELVDEFLLVTGSRRQPPGRRQVHARRGYSTLLIFRKR